MDNRNIRPTRNYQPTVPSRPRVENNKESASPCTKAPLTKTERLDCLNREHQDRPGDPLVREQIYQEVKEVVDHDPYLEYHAENTSAYRVIDRAQQVLIVPKERARPEPYPVNRPVPVRMAYRYLMFAAIGLVLSGLGALLFAPLAARAAVRALNDRSLNTNPAASAVDYADRVRARVVLALAFLLFIAGLALTYLLWVHIRG